MDLESGIGCILEFNKIFVKPKNVDFHITEWNEHNHEDIAKEILKNV